MVNLQLGDVCEVKFSFSISPIISQFIAGCQWSNDVWQSNVWLIPKGLNGNYNSNNRHLMWAVPNWDRSTLISEIDNSIKLQFDRWSTNQFKLIRIIRNAPIGDFSFDEA